MFCREPLHFWGQTGALLSRHRRSLNIQILKKKNISVYCGNFFQTSSDLLVKVFENSMKVITNQWEILIGET